jgi:excisionase family DNA binding protein
MGNHAVVEDDDVDVDEDTLLTIEQVARRFQLTPRTVRNMVIRGELRATRIGRKVLRFKPAWVEAYLDGRGMRTGTRRERHS